MLSNLQKQKIKPELNLTKIKKAPNGAFLFALFALLNI
jgi:hypothetical protein